MNDEQGRGLKGVDRAIEKLVRPSRLGYYEKEVIRPLLDALKVALADSPIAEEGLKKFARLEKRITSLLKSDPVILDDFIDQLIGIENLVTKARGIKIHQYTKTKLRKFYYGNRDVVHPEPVSYITVERIGNHNKYLFCGVAGTVDIQHEEGLPNKRA
jgi:hypothetical protein